MDSRYSRQEAIIDQKKLKDTKICIVGLGAVGGTIADLLARIGAGTIYLFDYDNVEIHNIAGQRFTEEDIGKPKVKVIENQLKKINSEITILGENIKIVSEKQLPKGLDYIFSGVDNFTARKIFINYQKRINNGVVILDGGLSTPTVGTNQMYIKGKRPITDFYPNLEKEIQTEQRTTCTGELIPSLVTTATVIGALRVHQFLQHLSEGREYDELMNISMGKRISIDYFKGEQNASKKEKTNKKNTKRN